MTSTYFLEGDALDSDYELMIAYINQQYDYFPTNLTNDPLSIAEISEIGYYDALGEYAAEANPRPGVVEPSQTIRQQIRSRQPRDIHRGRRSRW